MDIAIKHIVRLMGMDEHMQRTEGLFDTLEKLLLSLKREVFSCFLLRGIIHELSCGFFFLLLQSRCDKKVKVSKKSQSLILLFLVRLHR